MLDNLDSYVHGKFTASERRVLLSKWVGGAWEEVCAKPEMIIRSFRKCGISVAVDGSEDEVINITGVDDYTVGSIESSSSSDDDDDTSASEIVNAWHFQSLAKFSLSCYLTCNPASM